MLVRSVVARLAAAEGRHFDGLRTRQDVHEPKAPADDEGTPEERLHLLGRRVGGEVEILRLETEQQIANGATHDERLEARLLELARDVQRAARDLGAANAMRVRTEQTRLGHGSARDQPREKATNQVFDKVAKRLDSMIWERRCTRAREVGVQDGASGRPRGENRGNHPPEKQQLRRIIARTERPSAAARPLAADQSGRVAGGRKIADNSTFFRPEARPKE